MNFKSINTIALILLSLNLSGAVKYELNYSRIKSGDKLNYIAQWGILNIGSASISIDNQIYKIGSTNCYKIDVQGKTNGMASLFYVRDRWISYVDTSTIQTHKSQRSIREGSYELDETIDFDHANKKAYVKVLNKKTKEFQLKKVYNTPDKIRDVIAGFMVIRMVEMNRLKKGDQFTINGFYEDEGYKIDINYQGLEFIKFNNKLIRCHKILPALPKNSVFDGKNSVIVWLSDDKNQEIIRIRAKMFVGNIVIDQVKNNK